MMEHYDPARVEAKWQLFWEREKTFRVFEEKGRKKFYLLEMFPYPSGRIHMGHVRNYTIGDVIARYERMRGFHVLHPMGWDAFGLPAENAAIQHGVHPAAWTRQNIDTMRLQLKKMGLSYDWDREFATCDPSYYRWEQLIFLQMLARGLAYRKKATVNWCESCQTVLANEQVEGNLCWRCENPVGFRELDQWFFRITAYAEELLDGCDRLTGWPEKVLTMQRNWIGKSQGAEIDFPLPGSDKRISVFTTRPDTLFGVTFMSLSVDHPLALTLAEGGGRGEEARVFAERVRRNRRRESETDKEGLWTGQECSHPLTGEPIPIYLSNFVVMEYGTGAVMGVPAHDQRDFEFAKRYGLPIRVVIEPRGGMLQPEDLSQAYVEDGVLTRSGVFSGMGNREAMGHITESLAERGLGRETTSYRLRDWGISRQRYWGAPIPVIYCDECGMVPVPAQELPVTLPIEVEITGEGGSPLAAHRQFWEVSCPVCGRKGRRETDTMDTFVESSWYFARYASPDVQDAPLDPYRAAYWLPVNQYIGGVEHAVLHLLYARFFTKVLRDLGWLRLDEPFENLLTQGMVIKDGAKMSKSRGNVVDPDELIHRYGADTARLFSLFAAPPEKDLEWSSQGVEGAARFLNRIWRFVAENKEWLRREEDPASGDEMDEPLMALRRATHATVKKVTEDIDQRFHFNTAIAAIMELVNTLMEVTPQAAHRGRGRTVVRESLLQLVTLLFPFVPHFSNELWESMGERGSLDFALWPTFDPELLKTDEILVVVQVNGKVRSRIVVPRNQNEGELRQRALEDEKVRTYVQGRAVKRVIVVPDRIVNVVV